MFYIYNTLIEQSPTAMDMQLQAFMPVYQIFQAVTSPHMQIPNRIYCNL